VEGGNKKKDQVFNVDQKLVDAEASFERSLQEISGAPLPSMEAVSYKELHVVLAKLIKVARACVNRKHSEGPSKLRDSPIPEMLVVVWLEHKLITEQRWLSLLRKVKQQFRARPPVAIACLTRQSHCYDYDNMESDCTAYEYSVVIAGSMRESGKQFKDLNWLLVEDESSNPAHGLNSDCHSARVRSSINICKSFQELDQIRASHDLKHFFANHHALWLRWPANRSGFMNFSKRFEKIIDSGIPLFLLELPYSGADSAASIGHLLGWECHDFVSRYCQRHRRPEPLSDDERLADAYLYWEDHRYKPIKEIPSMATNLLIPPLLP
jgi:hypothetical protein